MTLKQIAMAVLVGAAGLQTTHAAAQERDDRGWYVGGDLSYVDGEAEIGNLYWLDENGIGFGAYGGYNFTDWFGLEGSVFRSTDLSDDRTDLSEAAFSTVSFMPKFTVKLGEKVGLFIKAGPTYVQYVEEYGDDYYDEDDDYWWRADDAEWDEVLFGAAIGTRIDIQNGVQLRFSYDYTSGDLSETWYSWDAPARRVDVTLSRFSVGVHYQF